MKGEDLFKEVTGATAGAAAPMREEIVLLLRRIQETDERLKRIEAAQKKDKDRLAALRAMTLEEYIEEKTPKKKKEDEG